MRSIYKKCIQQTEVVDPQSSTSALPPSLRGWVAALTALTLVLGTCGISRAETTAVSNLANSDASGSAPVTLDILGNGSTYGQSFTTGPTPTILSSVALQMQDTDFSSGGFSVSLYTDNSGLPGVLLGVLTGNDAPDPAGVYTYTAPTGTSLLAAHTYWIVASLQSGLDSIYAWQPTDGLSETGSAGWSIGEFGLQYTIGFNPESWQTSPYFALKMAVNIVDICCPLPKGHWKDDPNTPGCVVNILKLPPKGNAAVTLAQQWIAAVYNLAVCLPVDPNKYGDIKIGIHTGAPQLLGLAQLEPPDYSLPDLCNFNLPQVKKNSALGQEMQALATLLEAYNNGFYNDCDGDQFTPSQGDCNDANPAINPGAPEIVDVIDNNCNGQIDEEDTCPCPYPGLPDPELAFDYVHQEILLGNYVDYYELSVPNYAVFPDCLFANSGEPCGTRTRVDIHDAASGDYIYGFCVLGSAADMNLIWFGLSAGTPPPAAVYIVITDQKCGQTYTSNPVGLYP